MSEINSKKRILFIITQSEMGGAQRFLVNLLTHIKGGYDIKVAVGSDGGHELIDKIKFLNIEVSVIKNLKREVSFADDIRACFEIRDLVNKFKPNDLFLLSSKAGFIGSLTTYYLLRTTRPRIIYRIGGWTFNDPWPTWKKKLWINLERLSAPWKDVIIVNNEHDYTQADNLGIRPREKLILVHNGLDIYKTEFLPKEEARLKLFEKISQNQGNFPTDGQRYPRADILIGTIANLYPTKGLPTLIEAVEHLKHNNALTFFVIGEGGERLALEKLIKDKKLENKIFLLGNIPNAREYLQAFDIFVLPSLKEGFPWSLIEAMAARLPVIATQVGAVPEIIENHQNGLIVEPGKPEQIAKKITEILNNDYMRKELAINAHQTVLFKFSEDKMIKEIEATL